MTKPEAQLDVEQDMKVKTEDSSSLKGTLASVFILGILMVVGWSGAFLLFLSRN